jgi:hypothetical protein
MPKVKQEMFENTPVRQPGEKTSAPTSRKLFRETREGKWEVQVDLKMRPFGGGERIEVRIENPAEESLNSTHACLFTLLTHF